MGIRLIEGRYFTQQDTEGREPVVIVNAATALAYWRGESPVGRRIQRGGPNNRPWSTVVGVVQDVKVRGPDRETPPEMYLPHAQFVLTPNSRLTIPNMTLVVRTTAEPAQVIAAVRGEIRAINKDALITNVEFMDEALSRVVAPRELNTAVFGIFAFVALSLAVVGIYGVVSYAVARRGQEIGVRVAVGAQRRDVLLLVLREGLRLVFAGIVIGIIGAYLLTRWMRSLLFEVGPADPLTLTAMALLLLVVSLVACYLPARRAVRLDPLVVLREEGTGG
jgi:putative ABC transport system permease protein